MCVCVLSTCRCGTNIPHIIKAIISSSLECPEIAKLILSFKKRVGAVSAFITRLPQRGPVKQAVQLIQIKFLGQDVSNSNIFFCCSSSNMFYVLS